MKHASAAAVLTALLLLPRTLDAQALPDFSGTWQMDTTRSQAAQQGEPFKMITFVISQSTGQVRIEATRSRTERWAPRLIHFVVSSAKQRSRRLSQEL